MDEKRLNIEAPLLSVRRSAASQKTLDKKHILLYPKSDSTMQQLAEPVTVPLNWENILGRSKPKEPPVAQSPTWSKETEDERRRTNGNDDDDDNVYSDAVDTISPPESVLMNCRVSGMSGLELNSYNANKSGTFHTDQKIRDFMMNRFLPAAKAMTLQVPEYASRKQSVVVEQAREINRSFREEKKLLLKNYISDIIQSSNQCETEEESEDDKYDSANGSAKGCGLLPQLRLKNSLCLLNSVPGMKMRNIVPMSTAAYEVSKQNKKSHVRSYSPAPMVKKAIDAIYKNKSSSETVSMDTREARKKWMSQSCRFTYDAGESQQQDRLSPFRRSRTAAAGVSPCRSRPQYPLRGAKLLCDSREAENISQSSRYLNFQSRSHGNNEESNSTVEKTLYIDSASTVKLLSSSHSFSPEASQDGKELQALEEKKAMDSDTNNREIVIADSNSSESVLCPVPPPLPRSPSESWLWRALPLVSGRNPLQQSNLSNHSQSIYQDSHTTSSNNTKWETIVKTSNLHNDHARYSQEIIASNKSHRLKS
ncbi:uncharacterized protein LOC114722895 [Neltuma alba]|uniref:uncharacterized protein LOC114722895 n=1 Tax=Neltuma alba TaxID=207710 RepID=UPI0010A3B86C|nr:uncharacterized protein LOC114722895 [Prosopis alba]